jgi:molybdopterin converting factor small subunit
VRAIDLVKVVFPSIIAKAIQGEHAGPLSASILRTALGQLVIQLGNTFKESLLYPSAEPECFVNFYSNGKHVRFMNHLDTFLHDEDELTLLPSTSGG